MAVPYDEVAAAITQNGCRVMTEASNETPARHVAGRETILFVTGRLAEESLREVVAAIAERIGFDWQVAVPGVQVAALLHTSLLLKRLDVPPEVDRVILPGWVQGDLAELEAKFGKPFERGPKDLRELPVHFGLQQRREADLSRYSVDIIAEINHATQQPLEEILQQAERLVASGADMIDVGCVPGESSNRVAEIVAALTGLGIRVSIDSFDQHEVSQAVRSGATLILSCNQSNVDWVADLGTEVVAIPDTPADTDSLDRTIEVLQQAGTPYRIDPIIEPVGMGFTASVERYMVARRRYPDTAMMMGIGNVTELAEVDSAGVNLLLAAVCEELGIQSVLTTQVINWCRTAVQEFDAARRLVHYAVTNRVVPKHIDSSLVVLRDPKLPVATQQSLEKLAAALRDQNFRIFAEAGVLHLMNSAGHWQGKDPFRLFTAALQHHDNRIDAGHAFYLGYELARAEIAAHLGKQYQQDEPLRWGLLGESSRSGRVGE
jgi:dihydropteroate synthase